MWPVRLRAAGDYSSAQRPRYREAARQCRCHLEPESTWYLSSFHPSPCRRRISSCFSSSCAFFFIVLAFAFIGSLAFVASCPAGLVVWAEATDMLPTRAAQHTATHFDLPVILKELPITGHNRKGSIFGTQRESRPARDSELLWLLVCDGDRKYGATLFAISSIVFVRWLIVPVTASVNQQRHQPATS